MADREQDLGKVVKMPDAEELLKRIPDGTFGLTEQTDAFYRRFAESIGGSEKVGAGLNMAWELASYDTLRSYPAIMRAMVNMNFDKVVDAVTPDPEVAEQAKRI